MAFVIYSNKDRYVSLMLFYRKLSIYFCDTAWNSSELTNITRIKKCCQFEIKSLYQYMNNKLEWVISFKSWKVTGYYVIWVSTSEAEGQSLTSTWSCECIILGYCFSMQQVQLNLILPKYSFLTGNVLQSL